MTYSNSKHIVKQTISQETNTFASAEYSRIGVSQVRLQCRVLCSHFGVILRAWVRINSIGRFSTGMTHVNCSYRRRQGGYKPPPTLRGRTDTSQPAISHHFSKKPPPISQKVYSRLLPRRTAEIGVSNEFSRPWGMATPCFHCRRSIFS